MARLSSPRYGGLLPDGMNLNQELVRQGVCWWYRKYAPLDAELEKEAREAKKGLWADPQPGAAVGVPRLRQILPINTTMFPRLALLFREQKTGMDVAHFTPFQWLNCVH